MPGTANLAKAGEVTDLKREPFRENIIYNCIPNTYIYLYTHKYMHLLSLMKKCLFATNGDFYRNLQL